ncbi:MAG: FtsX-like permease family protein [Gammaproteobacteria bacterium]|nr:FtsX-like permease family protein [Gammaproteobacteria bacterium]MCP4089956.1 FtsX-like permease family protein [Gammaproteobacteria bacterium]MCP4276287.1 FtsX-like permease family protein [Gammaproteobacteria bacterium]MCP4831282.1 FtsX-like permease family protein [Gammaproteobacteria bacterium]MCP4928765.1 FtsX-like permease family protein [Gammaproteobacteria bacterium]
MMTSLRFALRSLSRDLKAGELTVLVVAIVLAVTSMTAIGFFTDRVARAVQAQAAETLAADLVIRSPAAIAEQNITAGMAAGLRTASVLDFPTVAIAGDTGKEGRSLALVTAVSSGYPLRGKVLISDEIFATSYASEDTPEPGTAWAEPGLMARLDADIGSVVQLGSAEFRLTRVLEFRPDQSFGFMSLAPTILVHIDDVPAMDVIKPGSRVTYRQLFAGTTEAIADFQRVLQQELGQEEQLRTFKDAGEQIVAAIDRAKRFLTLASLVTVILAAVATAMASRRYALRHLDTVALLKSMGATQSFVLRSTLIQLLLIVAGTAIVGTFMGFAAQGVLAELAARYTPFALPSASFNASSLGLVTATTIAIGFSLPHLLQLRTTPPLRVLRHDLAPPQLRTSLVYGVALLALIAMIWSIVQELKLLLLIVGGLLGMTVVMVLAGWLLVRGFTRFRGGGGIAWRYGLANISRRGRESVVQIVAFGLGLMVLLLLTVVRNDILQDWQQSLPEDAPNYFLLNIEPQDWDGIASLFATELGSAPDFLPLIRGRISAINGTAIDVYEFPNREGQRYVNREANLTWTATLPESNRVIAGEWWPEDYDGQLQVSLDERMARNLGISVGDSLDLMVGGEQITAPVTSLRLIEWDSLSPNFYLVFSPGEVRELPQTYLSSFYVAEEDRSVLKTLLQRYPELTLFDLEVTLKQVRDIIDKASLAIQYVFMFTLLAGVVVLLAAVQITRDERRFESAILHTLGARRRQILQGIAAEFIALGGLAGFLAALGASAIGYALAKYVFDLAYTIDPVLWLAGLFSGALIVGITGTLATRKAVNEPPVRVLRNG